jgi:hypothetical protein
METMNLEVLSEIKDIILNGLDNYTLKLINTAILNYSRTNKGETISELESEEAELVGEEENKEVIDII